MKLVALAALASLVPAVFGLTIDTPASVVVCEPTQLNWSDGTAPYYLTILPGGQPSATPLESFPTQQGTSYTWNVNIAASTSISIALKDATGTVAYTSTIMIQSGPDTSCLNSTSTSSVSPSSGTSSSTASGSSASGSSSSSSSSSSSAVSSFTPSSVGSSSPVAATVTASTPSSSGTTTNTSGAGRLGMSPAFAVAGLMGLVGAALF